MAKNNFNKSRKGILLINKPLGPTSHDIVGVARKKLKFRKIGHAGSLDPLAEGLLILLVGSYTKSFEKFVNFDKEYFGTLKLGEVTATGDSEGEVIEEKEWRNISELQIEKVIKDFQGAIEQVPPMVSALRKKGQRLYKLARKGITVKRKPRKINIYSCSLESIRLPYLDFYVHCSKGTYIRKLAEDIGKKLGCGAYATKILRKKIGPFHLKDSIKPEDINETYLQEFTFS
ncbi:MAG: tRNA pseudouridine(55) synthase TruB [Candidatus Omnitrophica bacterium]|nr:tRNA pseudouridine(55) synthase TruB [Candidatus Omnitrophota bacterium]MCF7893579.1 tRNA pseudouridine(55) synthase TruB [Candidatus Omnitrophota bacterium]